MAVGDKVGGNGGDEKRFMEDMARVLATRKLAAIDDFYLSRRTDERDQLRAAIDAATMWGATVIKGLLAIHGGALITLAAVYTKGEGNGAPDWHLDTAVVLFVGGVIMSLIAAACSYFNSANAQEVRTSALVYLYLEQREDDEEAIKLRNAAKADSDRAGVRCTWWQRAAAFSAVVSCIVFAVGVGFAFRAFQAGGVPTP